MPKRCRPLLGTFVEVTADHDDAIEEAFAAIARVHRLMSAHEPNSDVSRINRFAHLGALKVDEWTAQVLERALFWSRLSRGAFDVLLAGKAAIERHLLARHADQPRPLADDWTSLEVQGCLARLREPGCIDLGGIAKGFAVDRALDALRVTGCARGLVNAGGDLRAFGPEPWPVDVVHPLSRQPVVTIDLNDAAFATSAGLRCGDGLSFDHLGGEDLRWISVSVLAPTACDADALTKIVLHGGHRVTALLEFAGAKALGLTRGGRIERVAEMVPA